MMMGGGGGGLIGVNICVQGRVRSVILKTHVKNDVDTSLEHTQSRAVHVVFISRVFGDVRNDMRCSSDWLVAKAINRRWWW